jgi:hypothetical protein
VDLAASELSSFLHQNIEISLVGDIAGYSDCAVGRSFIDGFGDGVSFGGVDVADYDFGTFVGKQAGCFCSDALSGSSDAADG